VTDPVTGPSGYAGLVTRAVALGVDAVTINLIALLAGAAVSAILSVFGDGGGFDLAAALAGGLAWALWCGAYFVTFWTFSGQTPGARLLGIRVIGPGGGLSLGRATRRFLGLVLALVPFGAGFLPVLFDDRRRGLHDRIAGTVVRWGDALDPEEITAPAPAQIRRSVSRSV
jgi:uncharacterized RDD family membrane protein YckC